MSYRLPPGRPSRPYSGAARLLSQIGSRFHLLRAIRRAWLPLLIVYFAYGALGLIDISRDLWVKESLHLSPAELASLAVWLNLPWTVKMVFGQMVDSLPIAGSQRRAYLLIGAGLMAVGLVTLAGAAGGWLGHLLTPTGLYVLGNLLLVVGTVLQDVVADAMTSEVVEREDEWGTPRPDDEVRADLGMVQLLGRIALSLGVLSVAGLSGWLASFLSRETVFLMGLAIPCITVGAALMARDTAHEVQSPDWRILGGGIGFGAAVMAIALGGVPYGQELIFVLSMAVVIRMLALVTRELDSATRRAILFSSLIIFAFRAVPGAGDGAFWWSIDVLGFDETFLGTLRQTSAVVSILGLYLLRNQLTRHSVPSVLFWLTLIGALLAMPSIALFYGAHHWTEAVFGFGARTITLVDSAASGPFAQLAMVPLLTLVAYYAPPGRQATWFALMASLMNMALVAGQLQTKYLNLIFTVGRGNYEALGHLLITVTIIGLVLPLGALALFRRRQ
jgi:MFS family permease